MPSTTEPEATPEPSQQPAQEQAILEPIEPVAEAAKPETVEPAAPAEAPAPEGEPAPIVEQEAPPPAAEGVEAEQSATDPAPTVDATPEPEPSQQPDPDEASAAPLAVRIGHVDGVLHRVPLGAVQDILPEWVERIEALRISPTIANLQEQMRASEGRCAPVVFTMAEGDDRPRLFAGVEAVAAAMNLGLVELSVVTVASGETGALQSILAEQVRAKPVPPVSPT